MSTLSLIATMLLLDSYLLRIDYSRDRARDLLT